MLVAEAGGFYGGAGGSQYRDAMDGTYSSYDVGGGGSGYIGGVSSAQTIAGNASMPNPLGGTMTGNIGHGYARISLQ